MLQVSEVSHTLPLPFALGHSAQHSNSTFFFFFSFYWSLGTSTHSAAYAGLKLIALLPHPPDTGIRGVSPHVWSQKCVLGYSFVETFGTERRVSTQAARLSDTELHSQPHLLLLKQGPM